MKEFLRRIIIPILVILLNLAGCKDWNQPCIDADDFGFDKINISARGGGTIYGYDLSVSSQKGQEVTTWTDAKLKVTGKNLVIMVRNGDNSRWTAWWGTSGDKDNVPLFLRNLNTCTGYGCNTTIDSSKLYDPEKGCLFTKGVGLYALVVPLGVNPNESESFLRKGIPAGGIAFHLGESTSGLTDMDGQSTGGWNGTPPSDTPAGGHLFFKIFDSYYEDNGGQYQLVLKAGVVDPYPGPIATVVEGIKGKLDDATKAIYKNLVTDSEYLKVTQICLLLYVMFLGISFMFGIINMTQKELLVHVFKMALIIQVSTTATSWDFFNNYFLNLFKQGADGLVCMMVGSLGGAGCDPTSNPLNYFDTLVNSFTSFETNAKVQSLLFVSFMGFVFVIIFYISLLVYMIAIAKAVILYLLAYIAICVLIILFPIFLVFILFKLTRELFNNWLKQIISYSIQPLMVMAGITLMAQVVMHQLHTLLGFPVCVQTVISLPSPFNIPLIVYWHPSKVRTNPSTDLKNIAVPEYWSQDSSTPVGCDPNQTNFACVNKSVCAPYECTDLRYPDLPYLIPKTNANPNNNDQVRIDQISGGDYVTFFDVFLFLVLVYIMLKFQKIVPDIAKGVAGVVIGSQTSLSATADSAFKGITGGKLTQLAYMRATGGRSLEKDVDSLKNRATLQGLRHKVQDSVGGGIDSLHSKMGKKLTPRPLQKLGEMAEKGKNIRHGYQDSIGGKVDSVKEIGGMLKDQAVFNATKGSFGKNMNAKANPHDPKQVRSNLDGVAERFGESFGISPQYNQELKEAFNKTSEDLVGSNNVGAKYAIAGAFLANPLVGTALGTIYSANSAMTMFNKVKELRQRTTLGRPYNPNNAQPGVPGGPGGPGNGPGGPGGPGNGPSFDPRSGTSIGPGTGPTWSPGSSSSGGPGTGPSGGSGGPGNGPSFDPRSGTSIGPGTGPTWSPGSSSSGGPGSSSSGGPGSSSSGGPESGPSTSQGRTMSSSEAGPSVSPSVRRAGVTNREGAGMLNPDQPTSSRVVSRREVKKFDERKGDL